MKIYSSLTVAAVLLVSLTTWFCFQLGADDTDEWAEIFTINTPCQVVLIDSYADGGSIGGILSDEQGSELAFCWDGRMRIEVPGKKLVPSPRLAYLGAEHPTHEGATALPLGSHLEQKFIRLLSSCVDREIAPADQERLYAECFDLSIPIANRQKSQSDLSETKIRALKTYGLVKKLQDQRAEQGH